MEVEDYQKALTRAIELLQLENFSKCIEICETLINNTKDRPGAYLVCAKAFQQLKQLGEAESILEDGMQKADEADLKINLAIIKCERRKYEESIKLFDGFPPKMYNAKLHFYYGKALVGKGDIKKGMSEYAKCLVLKPNHKAALNNLANIYLNKGQLTKASKYYDLLIKHYPNEALVLNNLASLYQKQRKIELALKHYRRAIEVDPTKSVFYFNLGQLYLNESNPRNALIIINKGLGKGDEKYRNGLKFYQILCKHSLAKWTNYNVELEVLNQLMIEYLKTEDSTFEINPYFLSYFPVERDLFKKLAIRYANSELNKIKEEKRKSFNHSLSSGKIKVGYYSPNMREHPGGILIRKLFDFHDSSIFEVHAFSLVHSDDFINQEIRESVDYYHDVSKLNSGEITDLINRTGIDILVALAAYNSYMKFDVLSYRPAPIQMVMLGYHETTGSNSVDYVFSDDYMMDRELRENFTENVITLPCSTLVNSELPFRSTGIQTSRKDHRLPENTFIFASFNHPKKIDPETFGTWIAILKNTDESILWLYTASSKEIEESLLRIAVEGGISKNRIVFAPKVALENHLERIRHADLLLDCFHYNGHVTNVEALRMGVPFITLRGNSHNSRIGASILHYSNLEKLICLTKNDYIARSIELCDDRQKIQDLKKSLLNHTDKLFFDSELQIRYLEKAYVKAFIRKKKGLDPEDFEVNSALSLDSFVN